MIYRIFLTLLTLVLTVNAFDFSSIAAEYRVKYGIFGTVGGADCSISIEDGTYKIKVKATGKGLAKFFSRDRVETYESTGVLKDGKLLPTLFVKDRKWGDKEERKRYFFDHKKKLIKVMTTKVDGGKVVESIDRLDYYTKDDILTLFFNLRSIIGDKLETKKVDLSAVGARKKDGIVTISTLTGKKRDEISKLLKANNHILKVTLHQKIFSSKKGEFYIDVDDRYICDKMLLKDVLFYGDLYGSIKDVEIKKGI